MSIAAVIGFELTEYFVDEAASSVMVVVLVLEGELSETVDVRLTTSDGTATNLCMPHTHTPAPFIT